MIRVIGLGSPFGDDRAGWRVIELLRGRIDDHVELLALDRPGAALVNWMCGVDWLILVDALAPQGSPGRIRTLGSDGIAPAAQALSSHQLDLPETIRLAAALGCIPARLEIHGIEAADVTAAGLSAPVEAAAARLAATLSARLPTCTQRGAISRSCAVS